MSYSRKERRSLIARASKKYGIKGENALKIHEAYRAIEAPSPAKDAATASRNASEVVQAGVKSHHPWLILGVVALSQREGETALKFFQEGAKLKPGSHEIRAGIGKARTLMADPFTAVQEFQEAIRLGSTDEAMATLFAELMRRMGRHKVCADAVLHMAERARSEPLYRIAGETYLEAEFFNEAVSCFIRAHQIAPSSRGARLGRVKADMLMHDYHSVLDRARTLLEEEASDELVVMRMNALRVLGKFDEALAEFEDHEFQRPEDYQRGLMVRSNIEQDLGRDDDALATYEEASFVSDHAANALGKVMGSFLLRRGDYDRAWEPYAARHPKSNRGAVPLENASPENLAGRERVFLMEEQGVGDQFALLPMAAAALSTLGVKEVFFVTESRIARALGANSLAVTCIDKEEFDDGRHRVQDGECVFLGDLCRFLSDLRGSDPENAAFGGYVTLDEETVRAKRQRYGGQAAGRPIFGISWKSAGSLSGYVRSIDLERILKMLPENAFVVSLQYGDNRVELERARKAFPDMKIVQDHEVDPVADPHGSLVQLAALDRVITIDNTTAHAAGAVGHENATLLLPCGSERMWYWGVEGNSDPWYGTLNVIAQTTPRDWDSVLAQLTAA
ncbi:tetratricopeptide repeat protein [Salipiger mucosus]|uniref:TPR repeat protein n=1 Tax=Salipiger mucosus DSM 16094 TaxID=1123237 RepID=S9QRM8_9RHOB|nr:hypothetical protein [Salipiger mucosus]EPX84041.1 hypothetical protein Salmuc_01816 [Salipiger mucosus DSM 16094]